MNKLCIVTSVYNIRKTRPVEYYLTPAINLLNDMSNSDIEICVFTDQHKDKVPTAKNISVFNHTPEFFIQAMWGDPDWKYKCESKTVYTGGEAKVIPELIAIWLGKFAMMEIALNHTNANRILWQDSGIREHLIHFQDLNFHNFKTQYCQKQKLYPSIYNLVTQKLLDKHKLFLMNYDKFNRMFQGINMLKYCATKSMMAGLILCDISEFYQLLNGIKQKWKILVENDDYGTEEHALSLYYNDNKKKIGIMSYLQWVSCLRLISTNRIHL